MLLTVTRVKRKHHLYRHFTSKVACCNAEGRKKKYQLPKWASNSKHGISSQASEKLVTGIIGGPPSLTGGTNPLLLVFFLYFIKRD